MLLIVIAKTYRFGGCNPLRLEISQWPTLRYPEEMEQLHRANRDPRTADASRSDTLASKHIPDMLRSSGFLKDRVC